MKSIDRDKLGEYLSAYLDDELTADERKALERLIAQDQATGKQLEELRQTVELARGLPRKAAPPSLVEDLTAAAERQQLLGEPEDMVLPHRPWWHSARSLMSAAAAVAITVGGGWYVFQSMNEPAGTSFVERVSTPASNETDSRTAPAPVAAPSDRLAEAEGNRERDRRLAGVGPAKREAAVASSTRETPEGPSEALFMEAEEKARDVDAALVEAKKRERGPAPTVPRRHEPPADEARRHRRVVETLTLDQKLATGFSAEEIVAHPFANEANTLVVNPADRRDEERVREQIERFAVSNALRDVSTIDPQEPVTDDVPLFLEGRANFNYDAPGQTQFLMHVSLREFGELVEELGDGPGGERPLLLALGPAVASSPDETRALLQHMHMPRASLGIVPGPEAETALAAPGEGAPLRETSTHGTSIPAIRSARRSATPRGAESKARGASEDVYAGADRSGAGDAGQPTSAPAEADHPDDQGVTAVLDRFFGGLVEAVGGEPHARGDEAVAESAGEPVEPGRMVDRLGERLAHPGAGGARTEAPGADSFVTVVVQVHRAKVERSPATQPAETKADDAGEGGSEK